MYKWKHNTSTGNAIADISHNERLIRWGTERSGYLYNYEFWGDFSLTYPLKGGWYKTPSQAIKEGKPYIDRLLAPPGIVREHG